jgi:ribosomal protein S18 acetylase RimI-like enzyme
MTFFVRADQEAKSFLHGLIQPGKSSWTDDKIQGHVLKTGKDGPIVSAIIYQKFLDNENWVVIHALGTSEDQRKRGHARALLENLMNKDGAPHMMFLEAINGDPDLPHIYRNLGFIYSSTHDEQIKKEIKSFGKGGNKTLVLDNKA